MLHGVLADQNRHLKEALMKASAMPHKGFDSIFMSSHTGMLVTSWPPSRCLRIHGRVVVGMICKHCDASDISCC